MTTQSRIVEGPLSQVLIPSRSSEKLPPQVQLEKSNSTIVRFSPAPNSYSHSEKTVTIHLNGQMWSPWWYGNNRYENIIYSFTINVADLEEKLRKVKTRVIGESEDLDFNCSGSNKYYITINTYTVSEAAADNFNRKKFNNLFASAMNNLESERDFYVDVQSYMAFKDTIWPDFQMKRSKNSSFNSSIELSESFAKQLVEFSNQE